MSDTVKPDDYRKLASHVRELEQRLRNELMETHMARGKSLHISAGVLNLHAAASQTLDSIATLLGEGLEGIETLRDES